MWDKLKVYFVQFSKEQFKLGVSLFVKFQGSSNSYRNPCNGLLSICNDHKQEEVAHMLH